MQRPRTNKRRNDGSDKRAVEKPLTCLLFCLIGTLLPSHSTAFVTNHRIAATASGVRGASSRPHNIPFYTPSPTTISSPSLTLSMIEKAIYEVDSLGNRVTTSSRSYASNIESEASSTVMTKRIVKLLSDDHGEEDDDIPDYSEEAANELADKKIYSRISEEAKWKANMVMQKNKPFSSSAMDMDHMHMIEKKTLKKQPTKVMASVKETGGDSLKEYVKSMGQHELLPQESELLLGRHIQLLVTWEIVRCDLEELLGR